MSLCIRDLEKCKPNTEKCFELMTKVSARFPFKVLMMGYYNTAFKMGEDVFVKWDGESKVYTISLEYFNSLPSYVKHMILKSYENKEEYPFIWLRLYKDSYFNLANPWAYVNTKEKDGNVDSIGKKVIKPIKKGEELFGTYNLENTILK